MKSINWRDTAFLIVAALLSFHVAGVAAAEVPVPPPGAEGVDSWMLYLVHRVQTVTGLGAAIAGILLGFLVPQWWKKQLPIDMADRRRRQVTRRIAFGSAALPTLVLWPVTLPWAEMSAQQWYAVIVSGLIASIVLGTLTPFSYTMIMRLLYRFNIAKPERWSGETHAEIKREQAQWPDIDDDDDQPPADLKTDKA